MRRPKTSHYHWTKYAIGVLTLLLLAAPDASIAAANVEAAISGGVIFKGRDACKKWLNLATEIITQKLPSATIINLSS